MVAFFLLRAQSVEVLCWSAVAHVAGCDVPLHARMELSCNSKLVHVPGLLHHTYRFRLQRWSVLTNA